MKTLRKLIKESTIKKYFEGMNMSGFILIPDISSDNYNYYKGLDHDLLFAKCDDGNTTEWWLIHGNHSEYLGESYESENDSHLYTNPYVLKYNHK